MVNALTWFQVLFPFFVYFLVLFVDLFVAFFPSVLKNP